MENMTMNQDNRGVNRSRPSFWTEVFSKFYDYVEDYVEDYIWAPIIGLLIFILCMVSLYVQTEHPYHAEQKEDVQEESTQEEIEIEDDTEQTSESDEEMEEENNWLEYKYRNYQVKYQGKKGVNRKKAEKLLEQYCYNDWDTGLVITKEQITLPDDDTAAFYQVLYVRQVTNKKIVVYIKLGSGTYQGRLMKIRVKKIGTENYHMYCKFI